MAVIDDLVAAQAQLGRALGRARAGEDRDLARRVREGGEQLARLLAGLLRLSRIHASDNRAFDDPVRETARVLAELVDLLGPVHLAAVEDQVYVNDVRIRVDPRSGAGVLGPDLHRHGIGGLTFHAALDAYAIRRLVAPLAAEPAAERPRAALVQALRRAELGAVETSGIFRFRTARETEHARSPEETAARLHELAASTLENLAAGRVLNPLALRRMVLEILDTDPSAPAFWAPPPPDMPVHVAHVVQVAVIALLVARAGRFPPAFLQDLGIAAVVHDVGYFATGVDGAPNGVARHPLEGARVLLRQRGLTEGKIRRVRAILEHHRDSGQPGPRAPSPAGLILRVAEDYANAVRVLGNRALRSDIVGAMARVAGPYHPAIIQLLVNVLGKHPPGTLVELAGGRRARVACPARAADLWDTPLLALVDPGTLAFTGELVDAAGGAPFRPIPG
jgi:hypothetical protein